MTVNIAGTFKKDQRENNGLESIIDALVTHPLDRHVVVALVETKRVTRDVADGTDTPTVRFVMIEPLNGEAAATARELLNKAQTARIGHTQPDLFEGTEAEKS